jgi:hypothetical protein
MSFRYFLSTKLYRVIDEHIDISSEFAIPSGDISTETMRYDALFYSRNMFSSVNADAIHFNIYAGAVSLSKPFHVVIEITDSQGKVEGGKVRFAGLNSFEYTLTISSYKDFFNPIVKCYIVHEDPSDAFPNTIYLSIDCTFVTQVQITQCIPGVNNRICNTLCSCLVSQRDMDTCTPCRDIYINHCFNSKDKLSEACINYFQNYMFYKGPDRELDDKLYAYCNNTYHTIEDRVKDPVCACHLDQSFYDDIISELENKGFRNISSVFVGNRTRCILPQCANSNFPDSSIGKNGCQGVRCINAIVVNGNKVDYNSVTINQSKNCVNICSPGLKCNT